MYVGPLNDFFYKPKTWIFQQPKFNKKEDNTQINMNGKLFKINDLTGEMILCNTIKKQINFPNKLEKPKKLKLKSNKIRHNNSKKFASYNENYKDSSYNREFPNCISEKNIKVKEYSYKSPSNIINKDENNNNTITTENDNSLNKKYLRTNYKNNYTNITPSNNKDSSSNNKSIEQTLFSNINSLSTNTRSIKILKKCNLYKNEKEDGFSTLPYFTQKSKKIFKPPIAFGQYNFKPLSLEKKKKKNNSPKYINYLYLMHQQHKNNITGEGKINDKIYDRKNGENAIFKSFKDQILKERVVNRLKKQYHFFEEKNEGKLKVPKINHQNYDFYRGYIFSDNTRMPIYQKLFFSYIKKDKLKEKEEFDKEYANKNIAK